MDSTAAIARPGASTPGSVLRHTLGALTLGSPHHDDGSCFALPDVLDAPAFTCGASQEVGVFCTPDFITPQEAQFGIVGGVGHGAEKENRVSSPPCGLSPVRGKRPRRDGFDEDAMPASQGTGDTGRPPRHGGTPFGLSTVGGRGNVPLAPPFAQAAAKKAQLLAFKRSMASPPSHRNIFLTAPAQGEEAKEVDIDTRGVGSACTSRYRADFHQVRQLGQGSFSTVFHVTGRLDGGEYAVKRLLKEVHAPAALRAALTEVQALAAVGPHPWLVRYYTAWMEEHRLHIQLELCGPSMGSLYVQERRPLAPADIARLLACIASALTHLHAAGIAHMDVKPDNIFVAPPSARGEQPLPDGTGRVAYKLGDLGTACSLRSPVEQQGPGSRATVGVTEGDARYVSAEVLNGWHGALDRADVFALGATAYELARGEPLPSEGDAYTALRNNDIPEVPALSAALMQLLRRCMHAYPVQRPAAAAICAAMQEAGVSLQ